MIQDLWYQLCHWLHYRDFGRSHQGDFCQGNVFVEEIDQLIDQARVDHHGDDLDQDRKNPEIGKKNQSISKRYFKKNGPAPASASFILAEKSKMLTLL